MTERDLIDALSRGFPRAPEQMNDLHQSDAEILRLGEDLWAITVDDFSAREDLFEAAEPWLVGWNVVVATLSDLFSVGAVPRFFLPAVCLPPGVSKVFISELSRGTREALTAADCFLIGGDVGQAEPWRYVGTALGPIPSRRPLTRQLPPGSHSLWVSGPLGAANVAAALGEAPPRFPLRREVAAMIREHAAACIDTSGGFLDAVWSLLQATSGARMEVDVAALPMAPEAQVFAAQTGMPQGAALLGGAGEYELLFAVPEPGPEEVPSELEARGCVRIGRVEVTDAPGGLFLQRPDGHTTRVSRPPPCPRAAGSTDVHVREVAAMAESLFRGVEK